MPWTIDDRFRTDENAAVVAFILANPQLSAHDDIADALTRSADGLSAVGRYSPDLHAYAYFVLHTGDNRIFGIAYGQRALAYRVPVARIVEAVTDGATACPEIGEDWVRLDPWPAGTVAASKWCRIAHSLANR